MMVNLKTRQPRHWRKALLVWAAAQALAGTAQAGGVYFQPVQIPNLPGAGSVQTIEVTALNNAGQVVGIARNVADGARLPFLYSGGQMLALGGPLQADYFWQPTAISDPIGARGDIFVAGNIASSSTARPQINSFVQRVSTLMNQLSPAQTFVIPGADFTEVVGINRSGLMAGNFSAASDPNRRAFTGSMDGSLTTMSGPRDKETQAEAINNLGQVVGYARPGPGNFAARRAVLWNGATGAYQDIGTLGGNASWAVGLNDQGTVVGNSNLVGEDALQSHAYIYRNGVMTRIASELEQHGGTAASAINMKGQTLGSFRSGTGTADAFLHTDAGGAVALVGVTGNSDGSTDPFHSAINNMGQILYKQSLYNPAGILTWAQSAGGNTADPNNWDSGLGFAPNRLLDVVIGTFRDQTVTADTYMEAKRLHVTGSKAGRATLQLSGGALVNALEGVTIEARGRLQGAGRVLGPVVLNHGTVNALPGQLLTLDGGLDNRGLVTGNGRIEANLINRGGGAPGVLVGAGQHLTLAGTVHTAADASRINIQDGGTLAFEGRFVNQGGAVLTIHRGTLQVGYGAQRMDNGGQVLVSAISQFDGPMIAIDDGG